MSIYILFEGIFQSSRLTTIMDGVEWSTTTIIFIHRVLLICRGGGGGVG